MDAGIYSSFSAVLPAVYPANLCIQASNIVKSRIHSLAFHLHLTETVKATFSNQDLSL